MIGALDITRSALIAQRTRMDVIAGNMAGGLIFGTVSVLVCYRLIGRMAAHPEETGREELRLQRRWPLWPFTTTRG